MMLSVYRFRMELRGSMIYNNFTVKEAQLNENMHPNYRLYVRNILTARRRKLAVSVWETCRQ